MTIGDRSLSPGARLVAKYKGQEHTADVIAGEDGNPCYHLADGRVFRSPSSAGKAVMGGKSCNGWRFWSLAGAKADQATADGASLPVSGHTSRNVRRTGSAGPTTPTVRKTAHTARTARPGAKRSAPAKAKGSKTARKAPKAAKRTAKTAKR